jgi:hypothetical protein
MKNKSIDYQAVIRQLNSNKPVTPLRPKKLVRPTLTIEQYRIIRIFVNAICGGHSYHSHHGYQARID